LEVEGEEVGAGDEDEAVEEGGGEGGARAAVVEEVEGHDRVFGEFPFVDEEEDDGQDAKDDETEWVGGGPGVGDSAGFETKEEHNDAADDRDDADPVDGFDAREEGGAWRVEFKEY